MKIPSAVRRYILARCAPPAPPSPNATTPKARCTSGGGCSDKDCMGKRLTRPDNGRVSSTSGGTARYSDSKTARPNPSSSSAKTPDVLRGLHCSEGSTRRVSLRYVGFDSYALKIGLGVRWMKLDYTRRSNVPAYPSSYGPSRTAYAFPPASSSIGPPRLPADPSLYHRKSPKSAPAALSSNNVASSAPPSR